MPEKVDASRVLLSTAEASKIAGFDLSYVQRLLRQERIEGVRIGTVWLVYEDSLKAFLAQPRKRGPKGPRKNPEQSRKNPSSETKHTKGEREHAEGKEAQASQQPSPPRT